MSRKHTPADLVRLTEHLRHEAARPIAEVFNRRQKVAAAVPGIDRTSISRAANADISNPLYRTALMLVSAWMGGMTRAEGERIAGWPRQVVDLLWPPEQVDLAEALRREQRADAAEDVLQVDYLTIGDPDILAAYKDALERYRAECDVVLVAVNQRLLELRPQLAEVA